MGNYITVEILQRRITSDRLDSLCSGAGNSATVLAAEVIARAEALIDGYASSRYQTPLPANDLVREWALCIAEYELYKRGPGGAVPEKIRESCRQTLEHLKELSSGKLQIPDSGAVLSGGKGKSLIAAGKETVFDSEAMNGF